MAAQLEATQPTTADRPPPALQELVDWIGKHPGLSLGVAVCVGLGVGWLVKRR